MKVPEVVILVLSIVGLLGGLGWLLYDRLRRRWPTGTRLDAELPSTAETSRINLYVFFAKDVAKESIDHDFARAAIAAIWSTAVAWSMARKDKRVTKDESPTRDVVLYVETALTMAAKAQAWGFKSLAGYITKWETRRWTGDELPMIVISELNLAEVIKTGEPVIHEMLHALERDYVGGKDDHSNPVVWTAAAHREGATNVVIQDTARHVYLTRGQKLITTTV